VTCREFADCLMDGLSGELDPDSGSAFEEHLRLCTNCERYLTSYKESVALGKHAFDDEHATAPSTVPENLVSAILAARERR
jgi:anti-sigma factor RsiW